MELIFLIMVTVSISSAYNVPIDVSWWRNPNRIQKENTINNGYSIPNSNAIIIKPNVQEKPTGYEVSSIIRRPITFTKPGNFFNPSINSKPISFEQTSIFSKPIGFEEKTIIRRPIIISTSVISSNPTDLEETVIRKPIGGFGMTRIPVRPISSTKPGSFFSLSINSNPFGFGMYSIPDRPIISTKPASFKDPSTTSKQPSFEKLNQNAADSSNCDCGRRNSGRIVGGKETRRNEYPWMVLIQCGVHMCGGSIITPYHVLTAAHCTHGLEPYQVTIYVGRHNIENPLEGEQHAIARVINYKGFSFKLFRNDIALLVTRSPITFHGNVGPICLPYKKFNLEGKEMKVTGWGRTYGTGDRNILHEVDHVFVPLEQCQKSRPTVSVLETHLCAYRQGTDICDGDSGSPYIYLNPDNSRYYQVAVVSTGDRYCESTVPSLNTNVFAFMDWINAAISESKPGVKVCIGN